MAETQSNVRQITDKQAAPAAKFQISASLDGFPIVVEVEGKASDLRAVVDRLKAIGATPPQAASKPVNDACAPEDVPTCEFHGKMKRSNHGGFYCPKKMGDGSYCKSKSE